MRFYLSTVMNFKLTCALTEKTLPRAEEADFFFMYDKVLMF